MAKRPLDPRSRHTIDNLSGKPDLMMQSGLMHSFFEPVLELVPFRSGISTLDADMFDSVAAKAYDKKLELTTVAVDIHGLKDIQNPRQFTLELPETRELMLKGYLGSLGADIHFVTDSYFHPRLRFLPNRWAVYARPIQ